MMERTMKRLLFALLLLAGCSGPQPKQADSPPPAKQSAATPLTFETFAKVHEGQTWAEVVAILGKPSWGPDFLPLPSGKTVLMAGWGQRKPNGRGILPDKPHMTVALLNGLVVHIDSENIEPPKESW